MNIRFGMPWRQVIKARYREKLAILAAIALTTLAPTVCWASDAIIYKYDALGRLILADVRSAASAGAASAYHYDAAGNRTLVDVAVVKFSSVLPINASLVRGESVLSADGAYRLTLQRDGNLVLYDANDILIWTSNTTSATLLSMQSDGNLVLYDSSSAPVWNTGTWGHPGSYFAVQADGNLVVCDSNNHPLWARFGL